MSPRLPRRSRSLDRAGSATPSARIALAIRPGIAPAGALLLGACAFIEQYPTPAPDPEGTTSTSTTASTSASTTGGGMGGNTGSGGGATSTSTTSTSGGGGSGGSTTSTATTGGTGGTGGAGGMGGAGGAGGSGCVPLSTKPCYTGPAATRNVGVCKDGVATCTPEGVFGPCAGDVLPSLEDCMTPADEDCDGLSPPCPVGATIWAKNFGDATNQGGGAVAADKNGNVFVAGGISGSVNFGGGALVTQGPSDAYVAKLGPMGEHVWSKRFGGPGSESCNGIVVDAMGNISIVGNFTSTINFEQLPLVSAGQKDVFVAHFTSAGGIFWGYGYGDGSNQVGGAIAVTSQGDLLVGGLLEGTMDFGAGPMIGNGGGDAFAARLSAAGDALWSKSFGDGQLQAATATAMDAAGNLFVTGIYKGTMDLGLGALPNAAVNSVFLAKFDPSGAPLWSKSFPGMFSLLMSRSLAADPSGNVVIFGRLNGSADFGGGSMSSLGVSDNLFVAKLDPSGNHLWSHVYGGLGFEFDGGMTVDAFGDVLMTGSYDTELSFGGPVLVSNGGEDLFVAKLDPGGNHLWTHGFGAPGTQSGLGIAVDDKGDVVVSGAMSGSVDFGQGPLVSAGGTDILVLKLSP